MADLPLHPLPWGVPSLCPHPCSGTAQPVSQFPPSLIPAQPHSTSTQQAAKAHPAPQRGSAQPQPRKEVCIPLPLTWQRKEVPNPKGCLQWGRTPRKSKQGWGKQMRCPGPTAPTFPQITPGEKEKQRQPQGLCTLTPPPPKKPRRWQSKDSEAAAEIQSPPSASACSTRKE